MFITASKDNLSKLYDWESMQTLKTYKTDRPVNSAAVSPIRDQVVLGGGQEAMEVLQHCCWVLLILMIVFIDSGFGEFTNF